MDNRERTTIHVAPEPLDSIPRADLPFLSGAALIAVFAALFVWWLGHRGIFIFDHSIVFDGGYRVYLGQVPYKDILMAYLPGALWMQALFFRLFGVSYSSMILPACVFNALGAAAVMRIVWLLFPGKRIACLAGGLLTALWFQAPFGSLMHEQIAFAFDILALWVLFEASGTGWPHLLCRAAAGLLLFYAILCKQNAGGLFVPIAALVLFLQFAGNWKKLIASWASLAAGLCAGAVLFAFWVWHYSDFQAMRLSAFEIPSHFARQRILQPPGQIFRMLVGYAAPLAVVVFVPFFFAISFVSAVAGWFAGSLRKQRRRALLIAGLLSAALLFCEQLFQMTALNDPQNAVPFLGLVFGLLAAATMDIFFFKRSGQDRGGELQIATPGASRIQIPHRITKGFFGLLGLLAFTAIAGEGMLDDVGRVVHFTRGTRFTSTTLDIGRAAGVHWNEPNMVNNEVVQKADFERVTHFLEQHPGNFFTFPEATILYGLTGRTPPQPLLFFMEGHSYRRQDIPALDRRILQSLRQNQIRYFVLEKDGFAIKPTDLKDFPEVWHWLATEFHPVAEFGFFSVRERN